MSQYNYSIGQDDPSLVDTPEATQPDGPLDVATLRQGTIARALNPTPDSTPEKAAKAIKLSRITGMPAPLIATDVDHYTQQAQNNATAEIFKSNKYLREYVRQNPMAVDLSKDDWHNLDDITQQAEGIYEHPALRTFRQGGGILGAAQRAIIGSIGAIPEAATDAGREDYITKMLGKRALKDVPVPEAAAAALVAPFAATGSMLGIAMGGALGFAAKAGEEIYKSFYPNDQGGAQAFGRNAAAIFEWKLQDVASHGGPTPESAAIAKAWWNSTNTQHFLKTGEPLWYDPTIEKLQTKLNEHHIETLGNVIDAVERSDTWKADPIHVRDILKTVHDGNIEINGAAVLKLYGDKAPAAGDGLLGDMPGIVEQLQQVRLVGGDVSVPFADFAIHGKEVFEALKDDIRVTPGEITKNEVEAKAKIDEENEARVEAQEEARGPEDKIEEPEVEPKPIEPKVGEIPTTEPIVPPIEPTPESTYAVARTTFRTQQRALQRAKGKVEEAKDLYGETDPRTIALQDRVDVQTFKTEQARAAAKEVKPPKPEPERVVDDPVAKTRDATGLEPLFSIGDRKLTLEKQAREAKPYDTPDYVAHDFKILDETGKSVGYANLSETNGGKDIHVDMIQGTIPAGKPTSEFTHGFWSFGPALTRDLLRQVKAMFPNAERLGGYRVSGAREKLGHMEEVWINLDKPEGWDKVFLRNEFEQIIQGGQWLNTSQFSSAYIKPTELYSSKIQDIIHSIQKELRRIVGKEVVTGPAARIKMYGQETHGLYSGPIGQLPILLYSLEAPNPMGVARHEAIHHLRNYGLFTAAEWNTLERASRDNEWQKKFNIDSRYEDERPSLKLEESIAEGYRDWANNKERPDTPLGKIFQKIQDFIAKIRDAIKEALGKDFTWDELFERVDRGDIARRKETKKKSLDEYFTQEDKDWAEENSRKVDEMLGTERASIPEKEPPPIDPKEGLFATPGTIGLDAKTASRLQARLREVQERDIARREVQAEDIRKDMTEEWKHERKILRAEVETQIRQRPDAAVDLVLSRGNYYGQPLAEKPKLAYDDLTAEQRKGIPPSYLTKPGVPSEYSLDDLATMVGYPTGQRMVEGLVAYNKAKLEGNMTANDYINRLADLETDRQMIERGNLQDDIADRMKDHVLSGGQLDLMAAETQALAELAGLQSPIKKFDLRDTIQSHFEELPLTAAKSGRFLRETGKLEKSIKSEMAGENWAEAFRLQQEREGQGIMASEAVKLEKEQKQFAKTVKKLAGRDVKGLDQEYQDWIQTLLHQVGLPVRRNMLEIQRSQAISDPKTFPEFVSSAMGDGWNLDISPEILAGGLRPLTEMTVSQFREFKNTIDSLNNAGRYVEFNNALGKKETFAEFKQRAMTNITSLPMRTRDSLKDTSIAAKLYGIDAELTRMEVMMKAMDLGQDMGPLVDMTIRPLAESKHKEYSMEEQLSKDIKAIAMPKRWHKGLGDTIENNWFMDPRDPSGSTSLEIKRSDLLNIMLNWGNKSNQRKFVESWGSERPGKKASPEAAEKFKARMEDYINEHATPEDWKFVQGIWDIYKGYRHDLDVLWRNTAGTQPRFIEPTRITLADGREIEGGYYPLIRDRTMSGKPAALTAPESLFGPDYPNFATPQGYMKDRTGAAYYVNFDSPLKNVTQRMQQVIHDIAFRSEVMGVKQVLRDKEIRYAIRNHYGPEYEKQLDPWLQRTANGATLDETALENRDKIARFFRMNLTKMALPLNYVVQFTPDVGLAYPMLNYLRDVSGNRAVANEWSKEIPHAIYNLDRDFREAMSKAVGEGKYDATMNKALRFGYGFVSYVSKEFRTATFTKYFNENLAKGKSEVEAAAIADSYVREQHGSAALHDLPAVMAGGEMGRLMTMFYGYWNMQYNWQRTMKGHLDRGEYMKLGQAALGTYVIGSMFGVWIANSAKEEDTLWDRVKKSIPLQALGMIPYGIRELSTYAFEDYTPRTPLGSALVGGGAVVSDIKKVMKGEAPDKAIQHILSASGLFLGVPGTLQLGRTAQGLHDYAIGKQVPQNYMQWQRLILTGEMDLKHRTQ